MSKVKKIALASLLLSALVLSRLISIQTELLRTGIGFMPIVLCGILLGPWWCAGIAALGDVVGMTLFPKGVFFPGFTLSTFLAGLIYGFFLYNTKNNKQFLIHLIIASLLVTVFVNIGLNSLWLMITTKKASLAFIPARILANAIKLPLKIASIFLLKLFIDPLVKKFLLESKDTNEFIPPVEAKKQEYKVETNL
ncbi:MAG: folate family ECF transporter S component [Spirochaetaceae bacterium]|jgi:ECF transporter S component (folate family)|nr:folate family ECF transporter S component [Spirochaetaceae bacterium]